MSAVNIQRWVMCVPKGALFWKIMLMIMVYTTAVVWVDDHYFPKKKIQEALDVLVIGLVLGVLMGFRINTSYDRWWEGRKLWGQLVNEIRNLALKLKHYSPSSDRSSQVSDLLIAFPYSLRDHLRSLRPSDKVSQMVPGVREVRHAPLYITDRLFLLIASSTQRGGQASAAMERLVLDPHVKSLMDICGACERILKSPISEVYKELIWVGLGIYILVSPWFLVPVLDLWTLPVVFIASYFAVALELLAEEVEEPFGIDTNDLPLDDLCDTIEKSVIDIYFSDFELTERRLGGDRRKAPVDALPT